MELIKNLCSSFKSFLIIIFEGVETEVFFSSVKIERLLLVVFFEGNDLMSAMVSNIDS